MNSILWTPALLWYFDVYISDDVKIALSTHGLGNIEGGPGFYTIGASDMKELSNYMH